MMHDLKQVLWPASAWILVGWAGAEFYHHLFH